MNLKPQMGWSSWNCFREKIDEDKILSIASAMKASGLQDLGYTYINMDDCWQSSMRDEQGRLQFDGANFPSKEHIIQSLHQEGFKVGLYSACSDLTCEDMPGSFLHEKIDAETFAAWEIDYLKYDYCHVVDMPCDCSYIISAPEIDYISLASDTLSQQFYDASQAKLYGNAKLQINDDCVSGHYISGLDANAGACEFTDVCVAQTSSYLLTLGFHKTRSEKGRYAHILVNDKDSYEVFIPRSSGWSATGRHQLHIKLKAGANKIKIFNPVSGQKADAKMRYQRMGEALQAVDANIFYSISEHGRTQPWTWASDFSNSWRTTPDIEPNWESVYYCYDVSVDLYAYQKPGAYNDPDMLQVGNGSLTTNENRSHFALWCFLNAPLLLGHDLRLENKAVFDIISNENLIAINQDVRLAQAKRIRKTASFDVLHKELSDGYALCVLNKTDEARNFDLLDIKSEFEINAHDEILNLWTDETVSALILENSIKIEAKDTFIIKISQ